MIYIIALLVVLFLVYFYFTRRLIRRMVAVNIALQEAGRRFQNELNILTDQYRQLANINKALREVDKVKSSKKK